MRDLSRAEARRIILNFAEERVEILPEPTRSPQSPAFVARPREHRARQTAKTARGTPSDDPSSKPSPDGLELADDRAGIFVESAVGFADQLAHESFDGSPLLPPAEIERLEETPAYQGYPALGVRVLRVQR